MCQTWKLTVEHKKHHSRFVAFSQFRNLIKKGFQISKSSVTKNKKFKFFHLLQINKIWFFLVFKYKFSFAWESEVEDFLQFPKWSWSKMLNPFSTCSLSIQLSGFCKINWREELPLCTRRDERWESQSSDPWKKSFTFRKKEISKYFDKVTFKQKV